MKVKPQAQFLWARNECRESAPLVEFSSAVIHHTSQQKAARMPVPALRKISTRSVSQQVREQMRELVLSGAFAPGERLPSERDFTEAFGVSRTAVREALRGLEALGLLVIKQGAGVYVADAPAQTGADILPLVSLPMRRRTAADLIEVRLIVEPEISALAAERASAQDIVRLRHDVEQFRVDIGRLRRPPTDLQFHLDLCKAVHNKPLLTIIQWIVQFYAQSGQLPKRRDVEDHERVYQRVLARDASAARSAMRAHLNWVKDTLVRPAPK